MTELPKKELAMMELPMTELPMTDLFMTEYDREALSEAEERARKRSCIQIN